MGENESILRVKNLVVNFNTLAGTVKAVRDVSFELKKGETLAIVGESGSGKSVTVKAVMGLLAKNARVGGGEILYGGRDILKMSEKELCDLRGKEIAMIFQDPLSSLNPVMKVGKQITETLILNRHMSRADARALAIRLMDQVGIPDPERRFEQYPFQFSGGMRQRIVIAIALSQNPRVLICDEPTTALDVTIQAQVLELIEEIQEKNDLSVIFITHDLGVVANIADRICVMYAGKIVELGTAEEIFFDPRHPYTWSLLASMPDLDTSAEEDLVAIPGAPPNMLHPPEGDAFAPRNRYAMKIDFLKEPPLFQISETHFAATWLLHENAPKCEMPEILRKRIEAQKAAGGLT